MLKPTSVEALAAAIEQHANLNPRQAITAAAVAESRDDDIIAATVTASPAPEPLDILVVDDSLTIRVSVKALLERKCGHRVTLAENGREGLEAMKARMWSLVVSDIQMPHQDGFEMTQEFRAWEREHRAAWRQPLVLMSADASIARDEMQRVRVVVKEVCVTGSVFVRACGWCVHWKIQVWIELTHIRINAPAHPYGRLMLAAPTDLCQSR